MNKSLVLEKAVKFALRIVKLYRYLTEEKSEYVLSKQILISGTHIAKFIKDANQAECFGNRILVDDFARGRIY
jgi:four helix bundle protein